MGNPYFVGGNSPQEFAGPWNHNASILQQFSRLTVAPPLQLAMAGGIPMLSIGSMPVIGSAAFGVADEEIASLEKGTVKLWIIDEDGDFSTPPADVEVEAYNFFKDPVVYNSNVILVKTAAGQWLIANESAPSGSGKSLRVPIANIPGYSAGAVQLLGKDASNLLKWYGTGTCE
jgi:hypothetical protein